MISEALIRFFMGFLNWFLGLLPTANAPSWMVNASGYLATVWSYGAGLGAWIPWSMVGTVLASVLVCVGIGFGIKVARIVASFMTLGGGGAG